jgi:uncharacterized protein YdgA (DUF945 family)
MVFVYLAPQEARGIAFKIKLCEVLDMSRIHRRSLAVLSVLVLIVLAAPFLEGLYAKHVITHLLQEPISPRTTITLSDYQVGWFSSTAKFHVDMRDPHSMTMTPNQPASTMDGTLELRHGPIVRVKNPDGSERWLLAAAVLNHSIINTNLTQVVVNPWVSTVLNAQLKMMRATSIIELDGGINSTVLFLPTHIKDATQQFDWDGAKLIFSTNYSKTKSVVHVELGKLALITADASINMVPATLESDAHKGKYGLWLGRIRFNLPSVAIINPRDASQNFNLNQLSFNWVNEEDGGGDFVNISFDTQLQSLQAKNETHGPFHLAMSVNHLDAVATAQLDQLVKSLNPANEAQQKQVPTLLLTIFSKNAILDLKTLSFKSSSYGNLDVTGKVTLPALPPNMQNAPNGPMFLLQGAMGELNLKADAAMMRALLQNSGIIPKQAPVAPQPSSVEPPANPPIPVDPTQLTLNPAVTPDPNELATQLLDAWVASGLLVKQDNVYTSKFTLKDGALTANGKTLTPPQG